MVELIFVIVIIGILASVAIPKLSGMSDNAKKTAEIATMSALSTAIESVHGEWSINESTFTWGISQSSTTLNAQGYPDDLNASGKIFGALLKKENDGFTKISVSCTGCKATIFTGPASNQSTGVSAPTSDISGKPDKNDYWVYISYINSPYTSCTVNGKVFYVGDIQLIDINGTGVASYSPTITCN